MNEVVVNCPQQGSKVYKKAVWAQGVSDKIYFTSTWYDEALEEQQHEDDSFTIALQYFTATKFRNLSVSSETDFNFRHGALEAHSHMNFEYPIKLIRKSKYGYENFKNPPEAAT